MKKYTIDDLMKSFEKSEKLSDVYYSTYGMKGVFDILQTYATKIVELTNRVQELENE